MRLPRGGIRLEFERLADQFLPRLALVVGEYLDESRQRGLRQLILTLLVGCAPESQRSDLLLVLLEDALDLLLLVVGEFQVLRDLRTAGGPNLSLLPHDLL